MCCCDAQAPRFVGKPAFISKNIVRLPLPARSIRQVIYVRSRDSRLFIADETSSDFLDTFIAMALCLCAAFVRGLLRDTYHVENHLVGMFFRPGKQGRVVSGFALPATVEIVRHHVDQIQVPGTQVTRELPKQATISTGQRLTPHLQTSSSQSPSY